MSDKKTPSTETTKVKLKSVSKTPLLKPEVSEETTPKSTTEQPTSFLITRAGVDELVDCIGSIVPNRHLQRTIFTTINEVLTPLNNK